MYDEQQLQDRRDEKKGSVDNSYWAINASREDGESYTTAVEALSYEAVEIASCELHLGNVEAAREWFARAALADRSYLHLFTTRWEELSPSTQTRGGTRALSAVHNALLAGDHRLLETVTQQVLTLSDNYPTEYGGTGEYYWKACTIAYLVEDDPEAARDTLEAYVPVVEADDRGKHSEGYIQMQRGLIESDQEQFLHAIHQMLEQYDASVDELPSRMELMSRPIAAHRFLARDRGMDVDIDSTYLPDALDEYGIDGEIELPRPDYLREELVVGE
ncbi:Imm49 family immunity protein [Natrinema sp. 74]|uniref:Imm49 family immunity protein n=1 Tax=Natrinema sp. 74 TaxID=3384159 RepID=UPI0038D4DB1F